MCVSMIGIESDSACDLAAFRTAAEASKVRRVAGVEAILSSVLVEIITGQKSILKPGLGSEIARAKSNRRGQSRLLGGRWPAHWGGAHATDYGLYEPRGL